MERARAAPQDGRADPDYLAMRGRAQLGSANQSLRLRRPLNPVGSFHSIMSQHRKSPSPPSLSSTRAEALGAPPASFARVPVLAEASGEFANNPANFPDAMDASLLRMPR